MSVKNLDNILALCLQNDRIAQEKLYRAFFGLFYTVARDYTTDNESLLAIINEAFLKIFLHLKDYDTSKGSFETWSKRILRNQCIDHYRKQKNAIAAIEINDSVSNHIQHNDSQPGNSRDTAYYFSLLPETTGKVCRLFFLEGYAHKEIAAELHITESTSRWHVSEGKKRLQEILKRKYA
ncbi:RNA polymerase sigma factor [Deminuibacter soli]|uniref:RNA polymerase sigma factor n=1 Tax=Deminuibacter soli TaxID=2291815 RepID=UPI001313F98C|nr:sigma-70 family RNA polymerase sigma factor [Deminuibacter soli]